MIREDYFTALLFHETLFEVLFSDIIIDEKA